MLDKKKSNNRLSGNIAILGAGNIGTALVKGLTGAGRIDPSRIWVTRRQASLMTELRRLGCRTSSDNADAVANCRVIILAVQPDHLENLLESINDVLDPKKHLIISLVTGVAISEITDKIASKLPIIRAMPNTAVAIGESMTCLAGNSRSSKALKSAESLFARVGVTLVIPEEQMTAATALCACGVAFFLRSIRAASQGGIQIGFHANEALLMAAQTARGAASLLLGSSGAHPEAEIDRVTTPRGCTIAGLNRMEHEGFSSAMIKGIVSATEIANSLQPEKKQARS